LKVQPEDLQFEVKGASEYVEAATTVLLLERAQQPKDNFGKFLPTNDDRTLYFSKVKDGPTDLVPITLHFDRETMLFQPMTNYYNEDLNEQLL